MKSITFIAAAVLGFTAQLAKAAPCKKECGHKKNPDGSCVCPKQTLPLQVSQPAAQQQPFSQNPLFGTPCDTEGQKQCLGADFGQCNYGKWHVIDCLNGTACVPNKFECVPLSQWNSVNEEVNGQNQTLNQTSNQTLNQTLNSPAPTLQPFSQNPLYGTPCDTNGEMRCLGKDFGTCNQGVWYVIDCLNDTTCSPPDFQCVPSSSMNEQIQAPENAGNPGCSCSNGTDNSAGM